MPLGLVAATGHCYTKEVMRRLYSEHVPLAALDPPLLDALARRGIELAVALFDAPETRSEFSRLQGRAADAGTKLTLWPLLSDHDGRWPNAGNVHAFAAHVDRLTEGLAPTTLLLDVEPPIAWTRSVLRDGQSVLRLDARIARLVGYFLGAQPPNPVPVTPLARFPVRRPRVASHRALSTSLRERGWRVDVVAPPMLSFGARWQQWLGTSIEGLSERAFEPMAYTSLFEGYALGLVDRRIARDLLARLARRSSSVSLGVVGGGALGDERPYRDVSELADDVAICRGSGVEELSLYALDGILARGPIEPWLDAFVQTPAGEMPRSTRRGALLEALAVALG